VRSNGSQEIEEIEDNLGASVGVDTNWDEGREGVAGQIRI
jgi:hypothetical protein